MWYITRILSNGETEFLDGYRDVLQAYNKVPMYMKAYAPKTITIIYREVH